MEKVGTPIPGCYELRPRQSTDARGRFVKTFHRDWFRENGLRTDWAEQYYSVSRKGVLRGLHFQLPPQHHAKLVCCVAGKVLDVMVDLRRGSPTQGGHHCLTLDDGERSVVYMPPGLAHGFYTLTDSATLMYSVTSVYDENLDAGIRWDSAGIAWPDPSPLVSERDRALPALDSFVSPFDFIPSAAQGDR